MHSNNKQSEKPIGVGGKTQLPSDFTSPSEQPSPCQEDDDERVARLEEIAAAIRDQG